MRNKVLAVLLLLATSSTAPAATKLIKFGKLIDGTGGVIANAVVVVENDRVQRVLSGGRTRTVSAAPFRPNRQEFSCNTRGF
jgi:hypothetical protein